MKLPAGTAAVLNKLGQFGRLARESAFHPISGVPRKPILPASPDDLGVTFIGHSSFLLHIGGHNLLIDPVFTSRLVLLRRLRHPGVLVRDLPRIDLVLLTHAHMDHLNRSSLRMVLRNERERHGHAPVAVVPVGVDDLVNDLGFARVETMELWQTKTLAGLEITRTPSKHWGARFFRDTDRGFGGYVLRNEAHSLYHSGDTAYFHGFAEIGRRLAPKIALLPIGAYHPESFRTVHTSPEDALQGFIDLGSRWMIPMHYGTFRLSREPMDEPPRRLREAAARAGLRDSIRILAEGETALFPPEASSRQATAGVVTH
ncbi:MAG TPA: MBL fold metallo-hydrolase [Acidisarcina sp.]|nr:MBL fold metallo-hydrolase [Acidisarcina sp.]